MNLENAIVPVVPMPVPIVFRKLPLRKLTHCKVGVSYTIEMQRWLQIIQPLQSILDPSCSCVPLQRRAVCCFLQVVLPGS